jgi:transposase InsO family protein
MRPRRGSAAERSARARRLAVLLQPALGERTTHPEHPSLEIDIAPRTGECLFWPDAGTRHEHDKRPVRDPELSGDRVDLVPGFERIQVQRVMTDNGPAYTSLTHTLACRALGLRHLRTRPYRPRTNGKAERFIRTLLGGWAYGAIYASSQQRTAALTVWLDH